MLKGQHELDAAREWLAFYDAEVERLRYLQHPPKGLGSLSAHIPSDAAAVIRALVTALETVRHQLQISEDARTGNVWCWIGDGTDELESLTCSVLIHANELRALLDLTPEDPGP